MPGLFRVSEIVDMAIDEEHNGVYFYQALADRAETEVVEQTASRLAGEEKGHEARFKALKKALGEYHPPESYPGEYADYVNALVEGRTFPTEEEAAALADAGTDADAIRAALRFEKNTLLFMGEMRRLVPEEHRETVDVLIDEERGHLVDLNALLAQVEE
jgi:rubrerythrin